MIWTFYEIHFIVKLIFLSSPLNHAFSPLHVMEENQRELEDMDLYDHSDLHVLDFGKYFIKITTFLLL